MEVPVYTPNDVIHDSSKIQQIQEDDLQRSSELDEIINFINSEVSNALKSLVPHNQSEIDNALR